MKHGNENEKKINEKKKRNEKKMKHGIYNTKAWTK